ncbi:hypothetical protein [Halobacillus sp. Marseille-P3879]|uniref:hypothetical protein n=1 Tax=Halobacillus sp. Marseille-P3879 TaxID=2045014 RepID=UPI0011AFA695|nr:hypothetical protein [Halobacillus sp. Marseille-P3879]
MTKTRFSIITYTGLFIMLIFVFLNLNSPSNVYRIPVYLGAIIGATGLVIEGFVYYKQKKSH